METTGSTQMNTNLTDAYIYVNYVLLKGPGTEDDNVRVFRTGINLSDSVSSLEKKIDDDTGKDVSGFLYLVDKEGLKGDGHCRPDKNILAFVCKYRFAESDRLPSESLLSQYIDKDRHQPNRLSPDEGMPIHIIAVHTPFARCRRRRRALELWSSQSLQEKLAADHISLEKRDIFYMNIFHAKVSTGNGNEGTRVTLKFARHREEETILRKLKNSRYIPKWIKTFEVTVPSDTGFMIAMEYGGVCLVDLPYDVITEHFFELVRQLIEAVQEIHRENVAHLDLKPQNIVVLLEGGEAVLSLIDFGLSVVVESVGTMLSEYRGTEGFTAPEVGEREYDPILADIWSCGRLIRWMRSRYVKPNNKMSELTWDISKIMMNESNPLERKWIDISAYC